MNLPATGFYPLHDDSHSFNLLLISTLALAGGLVPTLPEADFSGIEVSGLCSQASKAKDGSVALERLALVSNAIALVDMLLLRATKVLTWQLYSQ